MDFRLLGSILLIVGTCVGAGMLGLPIATAQLGFTGSLILLIVSWFLMTTAAFLLLEVNLWMPLNSNMNTMARTTLGPIGQCISWVLFLFLLYSLLCAYIAGGSDLFHRLLIKGGVLLPRWQSAILFNVIFGAIVWLGVKSIDYLNRSLILIKFTAYFMLVFLLIPFIEKTKLGAGNLQAITSQTAIMVTITSFGFSLIIPSLRIYLKGDIPKLKRAIVIGGLIPLVLYIAWDAIIMGVVPLDSLQTIIKSENATSELAETLSRASSSTLATIFVNLFTSVCVLTSFLGVSLILTDFWADALQKEKKGRGNLQICGLTFLPPLLIVIFYPGLFVSALEYAGIDCILLMVLLPIWMVWAGRYRLKLADGFTVPGGKFLLLILTIFSILLLIHPG